MPDDFLDAENAIHSIVQELNNLKSASDTIRNAGRFAASTANSAAAITAATDKVLADSKQTIAQARMVSEEAGRQLANAVAALAQASDAMGTESAQLGEIVKDLSSAVDRQRADLYAAVAASSQSGIGLINEQIIPTLGKQREETVTAINELAGRLDSLLSQQKIAVVRLEQFARQYRRNAIVNRLLLVLLFLGMVVVGWLAWRFGPTFLQSLAVIPMVSPAAEGITAIPTELPGAVQATLDTGIAGEVVPLATVLPFETPDLSTPTLASNPTRTSSQSASPAPIVAPVPTATPTPPPPATRLPSTPPHPPPQE